MRVRTYLAEEQQFEANHPDLLSDLALDAPDQTAARKTPGTILVIIGESASSDHMKAYQAEYPYDDTPWMSSMMEKDAISSHTRTPATIRQPSRCRRY